ncbi:MAG: ATP-binding protein [Akkermansia sp.]|nr:ATP-binding protein [Akkermansia sp.]
MLEDTQIKQLLYQYNPWWNNNGIDEELPTTHRSAYKDTLDIIKSTDVRRFVVLSGARRIGKTTVMKQVISHLLSEGVAPQHIFYLSFDNPLCKLVGFQRILAEYDAMVPREKQKYFFLDEIQYAQDWSLWLKTLYDTRPNLNLTATGSASPSIEKGVADSGVGRWRVLRMPTLTFREYCDIEQNHPHSVISQYTLEELATMSAGEFSMLMISVGDMQAAWNRYIALGGFPELLRISTLARAQMLLREDVADKVLKRDIPSLFDVRNPLQLEKIFLYLCLHSGSIVKMSEICTKLEGVTMPTLQRYVQYLIEANLIYICHNASYTGKKILSAKSKIYVADSALRNACLMLSPDLLSDTDMGALVESIVYKHLLHTYGNTHKLGYVTLKGKDKKEVDFAISRPTDERFLCEVKYKNDSSISQRDAIAQLCTDSKTSGAFLITRNAGDFGISNLTEGGKPIIRIPAATFCYLLKGVSY